MYLFIRGVPFCVLETDQDLEIVIMSPLPQIWIFQFCTAVTVLHAHVPKFDSVRLQFLKA